MESKNLSTTEENVKIGDLNSLKVLRRIEYGLILDGGKYGDILLPKRYAVEAKDGDLIDVFVAYDSEDRLVALREAPQLRVNQIGLLTVVDINTHGAFLDWGLGKDLFLPFAEQLWDVQIDENIVVVVYVDKSNRLCASMKIEKHFNKNVSDIQQDLKINQPLDLIVYDKSQLGFKVVVNHQYQGQIYKNEIFTRIKYGDTLKGNLKTIRPDGKLDISLSITGHQGGEVLIPKIQEYLKSNDGYLAYSEKTSPEEVYQKFGASKKKFKIAIGIMYKTRQIKITDDGIYSLINFNTEDRR